MSEHFFLGHCLALFIFAKVLLVFALSSFTLFFCVFVHCFVSSIQRLIQISSFLIPFLHVWFAISRIILKSAFGNILCILVVSALVSTVYVIIGLMVIFNIHIFVSLVRYMFLVLQNYFRNFTAVIIDISQN